jgi:hypothetical protein
MCRLLGADGVPFEATIAPVSFDEIAPERIEY